MNIGLLVFVVSVAAAIGLGVYAFVSNRLEATKTRQFEADELAAYQANIATMNNLQGAFQTEVARLMFYEIVLEKLELIDLVAVPISDTWREQIKPDDLARFMHENHGCKLRMEDARNVVLYVPDEDIAAMARLAL